MESLTVKDKLKGLTSSKTIVEVRTKNGKKVKLGSGEKESKRRSRLVPADPYREYVLDGDILKATCVWTSKVFKVKVKDGFLWVQGKRETYKKHLKILRPFAYENIKDSVYNLAYTNETARYSFNRRKVKNWHKIYGHVSTKEWTIKVDDFKWEIDKEKSDGA